MNDITIVACILASITVLIAWMLKTDRTFAGFDASWNWQIEKLGLWFMWMASDLDDPTARKPKKRGRP